MKAIVLALLCIVADDVSAQIGVALYPQTNPIPDEELVVWTLTVWNEGSTPLNNVDVDVILPEDIDSFFPFDADCPGSSCNESETMIWVVGTLAPGQSSSTVYWTYIDFDSPPGTTLDSFVTASADDASDVTFLDQLEVGTPPLRLSLAFSPDRAVAGDTVRAMLTIGSTDTTPREEVIATLELPPGVQLGQRSALVRYENSNVVWDIGPLQPGQGVQVAADLVIDAGLPGNVPLTFRAVVTDAFAPDGAAEAIEAIPFSALPRLSINIRNDSDGDSDEEEIIRYDIEVINISADAVADIEVQIRLPEEINSFAEPTDTSCPGSSCNESERMTWDVGGLLAGVSRVLSFNVETDNFVPPGFLQETVAVAVNPTERLVGTEAAILVGNLVPAPLPTPNEPIPPAGELPDGYSLLSVYPNPFNPEATVRFAVRDATPVTLTLHDALGRQVSTLYVGIPEANQTLSVRIDGSSLSSGLYLVRLTGSNFSASQSVTLLK